MRINLFLIVFFCSRLVSQSVSVSGIVKNDRGEPLAGANVFIEGTALGAATDALGKYIIKKIPNDRDYKISAMYIGHRKITKDIETKQDKDISVDFILVLSLIDLDEVVVAASFSERKKYKK